MKAALDAALDAYAHAVARRVRAMRVSRQRIEDHVERVEAMEAESAARAALEALFPEAPVPQARS